MVRSDRLSQYIDFHNASHSDAYYFLQYDKAADPFATSCEGASLDNGEAPGHQPGPEAVSTSQPVPRPLEGQARLV